MKKTSEIQNDRGLLATGHFRRLQRRLILIYGVISFVTLSLIMIFMNGQSSNVMTRKITELISADASQLSINIDSYMEGVERNAALLFSDENYYNYDAQDSRLSEYQKIQAEEGIQNRISDLGLMENYSDFFVVYGNDHTVGWLSSTTAGLFPDGGIYQRFASCIPEDSRTLDIWCFHIGDNTDRCYYVKRLNPDAVIVASFFSRELDSVFELPAQLSGMTVRLADEKGEIIYSSSPEEIGDLLPAELATDCDADHAARETKNLLIDENACRNGWRVYTSMPKDIVLSGMRRAQIYSLLLVVLVYVLAGIILAFFIRRTTKSVGGVMMNLEERASVDQLSGTLNKAAFQKVVSDRLAKKEKQCVVFIMLDMDNFKQINDTRGHRYGDEVIVRFGALLRESLGRQYEIGRVGGDEFAAFASYSASGADVREMAEQDIEILRDGFHREFQEENQTCGTAVSIGVDLEPEDASPDFESVYQKADGALYRSKREGKDRVTWAE